MRRHGVRTPSRVWRAWTKVNNCTQAKNDPKCKNPKLKAHDCQELYRMHEPLSDPMMIHSSAVAYIGLLISQPTGFDANSNSQPAMAVVWWRLLLATPTVAIATLVFVGLAPFGGFVGVPMQFQLLPDAHELSTSCKMALSCRGGVCTKKFLVEATPNTSAGLSQQ